MGACEVAVELGGILERELRADLLALDDDLYLVIQDEGIVYLLAALHAHVGGELGDDLVRVEHVVPEHASDERHDECVLGGLFRRDRVLEGFDLLAYLRYGIFELHICFLQIETCIDRARNQWIIYIGSRS